MSKTPFDHDHEEELPTTEDDSSNGDDTGPSDHDEIARLQGERDELFNRLARATAEFQNARRRLEADKDQALQYANSSLIRSLLPVIDNFERALSIDPAKTDVAKLLKGMQIVHDQWLSELVKQQVELIAPEVGAPFEPGTMQALMQQPTDKYPENHVTQLLQQGYSHHGRVLRPAQVAVSKPV